MTRKINIRDAKRSDAGLILVFIKNLAEYEELSHEVKATEEFIKTTLFCENPKANVVIGELDGTPCGFALYFYNYSTFLAKPGIYLEDLFVNSESRGSGLGKALLVYLAKKAKSEQLGRVDWSVLNWNKSAIDFYLSIGSKPIKGWTVHRLDEEAISKLSE